MALDTESFGLLPATVQRFLQSRLVPAEANVEEHDEVPADIVADTTGELIMSFALTELVAGSDSAAIKTCDVVLDRVRVPAANIIGGEPEQGFKTAMKVLDRGRLHISSVALHPRFHNSTESQP